MFKLSKNTKYMFIQMFFWMIYCSCYGFASYYLIEKGFGTSIIGIITAIAGIISAFGQPFIGGIADRVSVGYKKPLMTLMVSFAGEVNFGMARGIGSFGYALSSYVIGYLTAAKGAIMVPISFVISGSNIFIKECTAIS